MRSPAAGFVLLISCPDKKGLIARITSLLFRFELNIVENAEFVDRESGTFYMRTEFTGPSEERTEKGAGADMGLLRAELRRELGDEASIALHDHSSKKKILILGTREAHCLGDLLLRHEEGELAASVVAVVSQYEDLSRLAARFEIPFHVVPVPAGEGDPEAVREIREIHEAELLRVISAYGFDYLVLAKYMRVLSADFVQRFPNRMINIHHSFLPAFAGKNPYAQAYERGVKIIGATAHFVNDRLDDGPIIAQAVIPINHAQNAQALARAGRDVEKTVLARALRWVLEDRVMVSGRRTIVFES